MTPMTEAMLALSLTGIAVGLSPLVYEVGRHLREIRLLRSGKPVRVEMLVGGRRVSGVISDADPEATLAFAQQLAEAARGL